MKEAAMRLHGLDHFTLRTPRLEATRDFFTAVAGLVPGPRPPFPFPGHWLYVEGRPVLHLAGPATDDGLERYLGERSGDSGSGTGAVDHVAFRCSGLPQFEQHLRGLGVAYRGRTVPEASEHQVFLADPNGVTVEFIFASSEDASWAQPAGHPVAAAIVE
jgi:catechol 2,3-dioxygenase-like lactoylglutathione lyase family enzyme